MLCCDTGHIPSARIADISSGTQKLDSSPPSADLASLQDTSVHATKHEKINVVADQLEDKTEILDNSTLISTSPARTISSKSGPRSSKVSIGPSSPINAGLSSPALRGGSHVVDSRPLHTALQKLSDDYTKFLVSYTTTILDGSGRTSEAADSSTKPKLESRTFKPHTMDNVRVRRMCDEMIHLQDPTYIMKEDEGVAPTARRVNYWMSTLRVSMGSNVHSIDMRNQPNVSVGGYFVLSQMLGYVHSLFSLDLSSNGLRAAEARVLALGLLMNKSIKELRMKDNMINCEGATSIAETFKTNTTLLIVVLNCLMHLNRCQSNGCSNLKMWQDLRENGIRGNGICALTDGLSNNSTLTHVDVRWNYVGEASDYVETALLDLKKFCLKNRQAAFKQYCKVNKDSLDLNNFNSMTSNGTFGEGSINSKGLPPSFGSSVPSAIPGTNAPIGKIEVTIISARNLPQVIWSRGNDGELGPPQAYVTCFVNNEPGQTKVVPKSFNPEWNDSYEMTVSAIWNMVTFKVKHAMRSQKAGRDRDDNAVAQKTARDDTTVGVVCIPAGFVINWRGVTNGLDNKYKAIYRTLSSSKDPGKVPAYKVCKVKDKNGGPEIDTFDSKEAAARAYDETALHIDGEEALQNFSSKFDYVGQDMKEGYFPLVGEDGVRVLGVQAGVYSEILLRLKFFAAHTDYMEIHLDRATCLPKMDSGLGTCDPYIMVLILDYKFRSRIVRNSLDPEFRQTFRIIAPRQEEQKLELRLQLYDWDRFDADDHMGDSVLPLDAAQLENGGHNGAYFVTKVEDGQMGEFLTNAKGDRSAIHLRFTYHPSQDSESDDEDEEDEPAAEI